MKKTKDNKGITLITLGVTIIIMLLLAGLTIYTGTNVIKNSREQQAIAELGMVNHAVYERYINYTKTKDAATLIGEKMTASEAQTIASQIGVTLITIPNSYNENEKAYYRLDPSNLEKIGIHDSKDNYIVNYVTGEVINETKKKTQEGKALYTYSRAVFDKQDVTAF